MRTIVTNGTASQSLAAELVMEVPDEAPTPSRVLSTGMRIGNFRVQRQVGQGGMAVVFLAEHHAIGHAAAIKVLLPEFAKDPEVVHRFLDEARAMSLVRHRGVVEVYDHGCLPDGTPYIVMEYLEGETLGARLSRCSAGADAQGLRLCQQVAAALAAAHGRGVVHRDLKPANVLVVPDAELPGGERAKLVDFGVAKLLERTAPRTRKGALLGTPTYMAPEQCRSEPAQDGRVDVYALGVILYTLLVGHAPFPQGSWLQVIQMHLYELPQPVRVANPRVVDPLATLVDRMLAKTASERPTMAEVARELLLLADEMATEPVPLAPFRSWDRPDSQQAISIVNEPTRLQLRPTQGASTWRNDAGRIRIFFPKRWKSIAGAALAALLLPAVVNAWLRVTHSAPMGVAPTPRPTSVRWQIVTSPAGADVVRAADGAVLGVTPWTREEPPSIGTVALVLRHPLCWERRVVLDLAAPLVLSERLEKLPRVLEGERRAPIPPLRPEAAPVPSVVKFTPSNPAPQRATPLVVNGPARASDRGSDRCGP